MLKKHLLATCLIIPLALTAATPLIVWKTLGYSKDNRGKYTQRFIITDATAFEALTFCKMKQPMTPANPADRIEEILPGYYAVYSPRFADITPADTVIVDIITEGALSTGSFTADGMHLIAGGKPVAAKQEICPAVDFPCQWRIPGTPDRMIYGDRAFDINDSLRTSWRPEAYQGIPTPKSVNVSERYISRPILTVKKIADNRQDYWRVNITGDTAVVFTSANNPDVILYALERRLDLAANADGLVPEAEIEDWADYRYRGFMLDVARNFTAKEEVKKVIDLMARYGLNILHFHVGDDEGWRVEIPEIPELTTVGARRGFTLDDNAGYLKQIYCGDGRPDSDTPANGFYTVDEYIDLLRYAYARGITIMPEFDSPGHSRAAIRATEWRARTRGDKSLRLIEDGDTSRYSTAQFFHDNLMNPALKGPYKFWDTVFASLQKTYRKAGVPMPGIHIGGDEVPAHAWDGSNAVNRLKVKTGITDQREVHAYFVNRVAQLAKKRGIKIAGWQEIALDHSNDYDKAVRPQVVAVNCWTNADNKGSQAAANGYPVVITNVDYLYFDHVPDTHPEEQGMNWGGHVDEFAPLRATIDRLVPGDEATQANVTGISGTIFSETVRSPQMVQRYMMPRLLGLAERAHNSKETLTEQQYFGALTAEMPHWSAEGINFYLRQPGIRFNNGLIEMNEPYGFGEIHYTLDGSDPTEASPRYTVPFNPGDAAQIRARLFVAPARSVVSILFVKE